MSDPSAAQDTKQTDASVIGHLGTPVPLVIIEDASLKRRAEATRPDHSGVARAWNTALIIGAICAQIAGLFLMWHFYKAPAKAFFWEGFCLSTAQLLIGFNTVVSPRGWNILFGLANIAMLVAGWHLLNMS